MSNKKKLDLNDDDSDENLANLNINKEFSEKYDKYRSKEVLQHLKDKYGDQVWLSEEEDSELDEESSSSEDESEIDENEIFDEKFFRVLGALKTKDDSIYDKKKEFYSKEDIIDLDKKKESKKKEKNENEKMDIMSYHKKLIKEKKGLTAEDDELENNNEEFKSSLGYYEELKELKNEFLNAAGQEDQDDIIVGKKVFESQEKEKIDLKKIIEVKSQEDKYIKKLNKFWKSEKLNEQEKFLRDYILNKDYMLANEDDENNGRQKKDLNDNNEDSKSTKKTINSYEDEEHSEIEYDSDNSVHRKLVKTYEETKFHHEEPNSDKIKSFPRQIESIRDIALRQKKSEKRKELKERRKQQKEAELKKLRELKRNEIKQKLELLEKTTGTKFSEKLKDLDIDTLIDDTDFDAEKYDKKMADLFNDDYYGITQDEIEKPKFEYDSEIDDEKHYDELDQGLIADDNDYKGDIIEFDDSSKSDQDLDEESLNEDNEKMSKKKKLRLKRKEKQSLKKKEKLSSLIKKKNYGIYEDVINGQGIRFKYRKTNAANYGLTDEEILLADEKELNKWASLKKCQQFEIDDDEVEKFDRKGKNIYLKKMLLKSIYGDSDEESQKIQEYDKQSSSTKSKKSKKRRKKSTKIGNEDQMSQRLEAYGLTNKSTKKAKTS